MKAYQVTMPGCKPFTYITETPLAELATAIKERFGCEPIGIKAL